jgi:hypothetical protein
MRCTRRRRVGVPPRHDGPPRPRSIRSKVAIVPNITVATLNAIVDHRINSEDVRHTQPLMRRRTVGTCVVTAGRTRKATLPSPDGIPPSVDVWPFINEQPMENVRSTCPGIPFPTVTPMISRTKREPMTLVLPLPLLLHQLLLLPMSAAVVAKW